jgi:uridine kinase
VTDLKLSYYLISICGGSASGKSLLLELIRHRFTEEEVCIVSLDDYYKSIEFQQKDIHGYYNWDLPTAIDFEDFYQNLLLLSGGKIIERSEYTFNNPQAIPRKKVFKPAPVVIIEGLFVFYYEKISKLTDLRVFIHSEEELRYNRRHKRDITERGIPENIFVHQWNHHVKPAYENYIKDYINKADLIIHNNISFDHSLDILLDHIRTMIDEKVS